MDLPLWRVSNQLEFLEYYSGLARVSRYISSQGTNTRAYDVTYDCPSPWKRSKHTGKKKRSGMDILGEAGFLLLGPSLELALFEQLFSFTCVLFNKKKAMIIASQELCFLEEGKHLGHKASMRTCFQASLVWEPEQVLNTFP